jgi:thiol-disulfide isomerase/thioredoxin
MNRHRIDRVAALAVRTFALVAALRLAGGAGLEAQTAPADSLLRDFGPNADFVLVVDGQEKPAAEIYFAQAARAYLVITSELPSPLLINAGAQTVETVDLMKVSRQVDGSVSLLADVELTPAGKFSIAGEEIEFSIGARKLRLKQRPWAVGKQSGADLLKSNASYRYIAHGFHPDASIVKRLKGSKEPVRVLTFFGSWCPHCKRHLPLLLKTEEQLAGSKIKFEYYGLPRPFDADAEAKKHNIVSVPTAILFVGDKEIGRIPSSQWSNPEVAIDLQLNGPGRSK